MTESTPVQMDLTGLKCPQPVLRIAISSRKLPAGTVIDVRADCSDFPADIRRWCDNEGKALLWCNPSGDGWSARVVL